MHVTWYIQAFVSYNLHLIAVKYFFTKFSFIIYKIIITKQKTPSLNYLKQGRLHPEGI